MKKLTLTLIIFTMSFFGLAKKLPLNILDADCVLAITLKPESAFNFYGEKNYLQRKFIGYGFNLVHVEVMGNKIREENFNLEIANKKPKYYISYYLQNTTGASYAKVKIYEIGNLKKPIFKIMHPLEIHLNVKLSKKFNTFRKKYPNTNKKEYDPSVLKSTINPKRLEIQKEEMRSKTISILPDDSTWHPLPKNLHKEGLYYIGIDNEIYSDSKDFDEKISSAMSEYPFKFKVYSNNNLPVHWSKMHEKGYRYRMRFRRTTIATGSRSNHNITFGPTLSIYLEIFLEDLVTGKFHKIDTMKKNDGVDKIVKQFIIDLKKEYSLE